MARERPYHPLFKDAAAEAFATAEEAWLWCARCQIARDDGARYVAGAATIERPCDPDDIMRELGRLYRRRMLRRAHLTVLDRFGRRMERPDPREGDSPTEAGLWDEALDRLATPLKEKGIVS